jgi:mRNA-degrading endonuclease RelE of RelBE toxin-antitoxin system
MKWTVIWKSDAERQLTSLWLSSRRRQSIKEAAEELDRAAAWNPIQLGESREMDERIVIIRPLAARIKVIESAQTVFVLGVWEF